MKKFAIALLVVAVLTLGLVGTATAASAPSATGGGGTDWGDGSANIAFTAIQVDASTGAAKGQFDYADTEGTEVHGKVLYLAVNTNNAWIGVKVTQSNYTGAPVGSEWVFQVRDNGEGKRSIGPDLISEFFKVSAWLAVSQPDLSGTFSAWDRGNIQVFPGE